MLEGKEKKDCVSKFFNQRNYKKRFGSEGLEKKISKKQAIIYDGPGLIDLQRDGYIIVPTYNFTVDEIEEFLQSYFFTKGSGHYTTRNGVIGAKVHAFESV